MARWHCHVQEKMLSYAPVPFVPTCSPLPGVFNVCVCLRPVPVCLVSSEQLTTPSMCSRVPCQGCCVYITLPLLFCLSSSKE